MIGLRSTLLVILAASTTDSTARSSAEISLRDRVFIATQIYHQVATFYPELSQKQFDQDYREYLAGILNASADRKAFDLASMELVASLHDSHTWFYDDWLAMNYGQPLGFTAYRFDEQWVVVQSWRSSLRVGDVIKAVDGIPTQRYFEERQKYISASSRRDAGTSFFHTPVLFPERFTLGLDGNREVVVDRKHEVTQRPPVKTEGRWLAEGLVGYIKLPIFRGIETQVAALDFLKQYRGARTVILDIRGNPGAGDPSLLQRALMDRSYPLWTEHSAVHGGFLLRAYDIAYPEKSDVTTREATVRLHDQPAFTGRLILLIDRGCTCACEDFAMPFKVSKRAQLIGETTAGSFSFTNSTDFENGMRLNIASVRHTFPDGSRFEGVGITPDIEIHPTAKDFKQGKDPVLDRALGVAISER